jgi:hypothetical protein
MRSLGLILLLASCAHPTAIQTPIASVTVTDRWAPTEDCDVAGPRSITTAIVIGRAIALADRDGLPLTPVFADRLPRIVVVATRDAPAVPSSTRALVIAVDADERGHAIVHYGALGYGTVYCAVLRDGQITMGQPPLDVRQAPRAFTRP